MIKFFIKFIINVDKYCSQLLNYLESITYRNLITRVIEPISQLHRSLSKHDFNSIVNSEFLIRKIYQIYN